MTLLKADIDPDWRIGDGNAGREQVLIAISREPLKSGHIGHYISGSELLHSRATAGRGVAAKTVRFGRDGGVRCNILGCLCFAFDVNFIL